ncbi:MAG: cupin domain-containing protein [Anaerolineales bacterium]|nr:cupin domain-containing protein [Anaerolineales bacterium]
MKVEHYTNITSEEVENVPGVSVRWVISAKDGAPTFAMRVFDVQPGQATPFHDHEWEHEVFVLDGEGLLRGQDQEWNLGTGSVVFVPGMEKHQFINRGENVLRFICLIPNLPE